MVSRLISGIASCSVTKRGVECVSEERRMTMKFGAVVLCIAVCLLVSVNVATHVYSTGGNVDSGTSSAIILAKQCPTCHGHGAIQCPVCKGSGKVSGKKCGTCKGSKKIVCGTCEGTRSVK